MSSRKYKCPYCLEGSYTKEEMIDHLDHKHREMIPQEWSAGRLAFKIINKKDHGTCIVCKKETPWNEKRCKYQRLCGNPKCKAVLREAAVKNHVKVYNVETLLTDPEHQKEMLSHRRIAGEYKFKDGGKIGYVGSYERKLLEFFDKVLEVPSTDIMEPGPTLEYDFNGKKHEWITDFLYIPYNLIIEVKDGGDNPNRTNMPITRQKTIYKEKMITELGTYNYIRLTNNDFVQLLDIFAELKMQMIDDDMENKKAIIHINENNLVIQEFANQREALENALKKHPAWNKIKNNKMLENSIDTVLSILKPLGDFSIEVAVTMIVMFTVQIPLYYATFIQTVLELPVSIIGEIKRLVENKKTKPNIIPVRTNHLKPHQKMLCLNTHPTNIIIGAAIISPVLAALIEPKNFLSLTFDIFKSGLIIFGGNEYEARDFLIMDENAPLTEDSTSLGTEETKKIDTDIVAVNDGIVIWSEESGLYEKKEYAHKISKQIRMAGNCVIIFHDLGVYSLYAHLKAGSIKVKPGQRVNQGDIIAKMGDTGNSFEPHLHFQMSFTNPIGQFISLGRPLTDFEYLSIDMSIFTMINGFKINDYLKRRDYTKKKGHVCSAGFVKEV